MKTSSVLEVRKLFKRFHGHAAVSDVSFKLAPGEILGYLGPNGSGKSLTIKIVTGLIEPSNGHVLYDGTDVTGGHISFRRRFGYVPEEPHLYPFLSGREQLELVADLRNLPADNTRRKIDALLQTFGIIETAEQSIASYSKGMRQKVLLIAALLHNPDVLILDEPESGLDVGSILLLRNLIRVLARRGKAVLYSSHVIENIERLCSRIIVLSSGRIIMDSDAEELRRLVPSGSLEEAFSTLAGQDPEAAASEVADIVME